MRQAARLRACACAGITNGKYCAKEESPDLRCLRHILAEYTYTLTCQLILHPFCAQTVHMHSHRLHN